MPVFGSKSGKAVFGGGLREASPSNHRLLFDAYPDDDNMPPPPAYTKLPQQVNKYPMYNTSGEQTDKPLRPPGFDLRIQRALNHDTYLAHSPTQTFGGGASPLNTNSLFSLPNGVRANSRLLAAANNARRGDFATLPVEEELKGTVAFASKGHVEEGLILPSEAPNETTPSERYGGVQSLPRQSTTQQRRPSFYEETLSRREQRELLEDASDPDNTFCTVRLNYVPGIESHATEFAIHFSQPLRSGAAATDGACHNPSVVHDPIVFGPLAAQRLEKEKELNRKRKEERARREMDTLVEYWARGGREIPNGFGSSKNERTPDHTDSQLSDGSAIGPFLQPSESLRRVMEFCYTGGGRRVESPSRPVSVATNVCARRVGVFPVGQGSKKALLAHAARFGTGEN